MPMLVQPPTNIGHDPDHRLRNGDLSRSREVLQPIESTDNLLLLRRVLLTSSQHSTRSFTHRLDTLADHPVTERGARQLEEK